MTIKGILVVGLLEDPRYTFINGAGIYTNDIANNLKGANLAIGGLSRGIFPFTKVIPLINEIGIEMQMVKNDVTISSQYLDSSSTILNNQFFKDNEIISVINPQQSNIQFTWQCANPQDGRVLFKTYEKFGRLYSEFIKNLIKQKMSSKNIISFKGSDNSENLFQVNNMANFTQNIEIYNEDLRKFNGNHDNLIQYYNTRIDLYKELLKEKKVETLNVNYDFLIYLAEKKWSFFNEEFVLSLEENNTLTETTTTIKELPINLDMFIALTNAFYIKGLNSPIQKLYGENIKPVIFPYIDWTNCYYIDTQFNFIINGKITNFRSDSNQNSNLVSYSVVVSNRTTSNLMPTNISLDNLKTVKKTFTNTATGDAGVGKEEKIIDPIPKKAKPFTKKTITERVY